MVIASIGHLERGLKAGRLLHYRRMKRKLGKRFGIKYTPITVRRQIQFIKQDESDSLEAYSQKVMVMVMDGFPGAREKIQEQIAVEHFLRGCIDHRAASVPMEKIRV